LAKCIYEYAFDHPRVQNPAHVRYTVDPTRFVDDPATGLHLRWDGAYWVSEMIPAGAAKGSVDLTTYALGSLPVPGATFSAVNENLSAGRDFCGPNPAVQTQDIWTEQGRSVELQPAPVERRLVGTVTGLSALTVAVDRAAPGHGRLSLDVTADQDVLLTLTSSGAAPRHVALHAGRNQLTVPPG
jgi:hypothetical protein